MTRPIGRCLQGSPAGRLVLDATDTRPHNATEAAAGWLFHYLIGLAYAVMFPLFWGVDFIVAPRSSRSS